MFERIRAIINENIIIIILEFNHGKKMNFMLNLCKIWNLAKFSVDFDEIIKSIPNSIIVA